ncbi:Lipin/Ned1/Smp2-domain-containing protein [Crepidotus variabilis]|uniref:phosphatidate phosphatase n=1 Tax=Crepidotus variabilis TaxID=179855 RepID=A0A9P6EFX9_9AGAR|nr:Lipin/Ned1/Smp2-domain-containing protein [Crepidotus variabilis]
MNYLRGAVSAISAPYQYYKDINPSTLTGAIDVIVIQRPSSSGDGTTPTELVCSPFHVRFGKWQLLRPSDKKVNVFVNGVKIPFDMKVGEAGEAFFVFETDDDVPADLITSPVLHATTDLPEKDGGKGGEQSDEEEPAKGDRFGAKKSDQDKEEQAAKGSEPDFLDLNEGSGSGDANSSTKVSSSPELDFRTTPKQTHYVPRALRKQDSRATISASNSQSKRNGNALPSPPLSRDHSLERKRQESEQPGRSNATSEQDRRVDAALTALNRQTHVPEVEYHHDVTLDMEGYKQDYHEEHPLHHNHKSNHDREASDQTIRSASTTSNTDEERLDFPSSAPGPLRKPHLNPHVQSETNSPYASSPPSSPSPSSSESSSRPESPNTREPLRPPKLIPDFRATSESPPDTDDVAIAIENPSPRIHSATIPVLHLRPHPHRAHLQHTHSLSLTTSPAHTHHAHDSLPQEYSWEWGAFPQPSPIKATFSKGGRLEPPKGLRLGRGLSTLKEKRKEKRRAVGFEMETSEEALTLRDNGTNAGSSSHTRSQSVPPALEGSPTKSKGRRQYKEYEDYEEEESDDEDDPFADGRKKRGRGGRNRRRILEYGKTPTQETAKFLFDQEDEDDDEDAEEGGISSFDFGRGGILSPSPDDPSLFILQLEGSLSFSSTAFQLSLVPDSDSSLSTTSQLAESFDRYKVDFERFIADESIVHDPRLVVRWGGEDSEQYVRRTDGSVVFGGLGGWREGTIRKPRLPEEQISRQQRIERAEEEGKNMLAENKDTALEGREGNAGGDEKETPTKKPTSTSWVQWWRSSGSGDNLKAPGSKPTPITPNGTVLGPDKSTASLPLPSTDRPKLDETIKSHSVDTFNEKGSRPTHIPMPAPSKKFAKTLRLTSEQLKSLKLKPGANSITFSLSASGAVAATARIFVWDSTDLVVISDIDGTITKSDGLGHVFAMIGRDWTHSGVAKLYTDIVKNGYKIMYLTSRAIGQADATRDYLRGVKQADYRLPEGPVIMSPDRLMASLHREVIMRKPEVFKMACLRDIQRLFGESARNPFYAGFGNRITDALSYRSVNVPSMRIFTIDSTGEVKMELLELAGYKSSYIYMTDLVDQMFPPIHRKWAPEFTDFNYWKPPVQDFPLPDLSPPSPTLSARSDISNQSALARLRNFSLAGGRTNSNRLSQHIARQSSLSSVINDVRQEIEGANGQGSAENSSDGYKNSHLRQMSSFEKLSSTLGSMVDTYRRSASPSSSFLDSDDEDEDGDELDLDGKRRKRQRRRSMTSMPGTLDEAHFGLDDEDGDFAFHESDKRERFVQADPEEYDEGAGAHGVEDEEEYEGEDMEEREYDAEEEAEAAFDEDLLAAGEMQKVPFL